MTRYKLNDVLKTTVICSGLIEFPDGWFSVTIKPNSLGRVVHIYLGNETISKCDYVSVKYCFHNVKEYEPLKFPFTLYMVKLFHAGIDVSRLLPVPLRANQILKCYGKCTQCSVKDACYGVSDLP
jgi:hypothetical protein